MILPTLNREKELWNQGFKNIIGLDEVGRGCLAGPLIAAAALIENQTLADWRNSHKKILGFIRDSKFLAWKKREEIFKEMAHSGWLKWSIGVVEVREIDDMGMAEANRLSIRRALGQLRVKPDWILIDAVKLPEYTHQSESIIKGDQNVFSIACASIVAKVTRDKMMRELAQKYPYWGFDKHKGYGTGFHLEMIKKYGISAIHRRSFRPLKLEIKRLRD